MRVIHTGIQSVPAVGVLRQLEAEAKSSEALGINWLSVLYTGESVPDRVNEQSTKSADNRFSFRLAYYKWLYKKSRDFDIILLRYSFYDPLQLLFILFCGRTVYTVHHTLEIPELKLSGSRMSWAKTALERILGPLTLSVVSGIVAVSSEILDYEMNRRLVKRSIPNKVYTNGVDYYDDLNLTSIEEAAKNKSAPEFLFVSSIFREWQGLEDLFSEAKRFNGLFVCHVVGELTDQQKMMLKNDSRFIAHGLLNKTAIRELIRKSDIGISNLSASKKNMNYVPALKVREYLMEGLAVYAGHGDILPDSFAYYRNGPIDLMEMVAFANESRGNNRTMVSEASRPFIEKEKLLKDLHSFLLENQKN